MVKGEVSHSETNGPGSGNEMPRIKHFKAVPWLLVDFAQRGMSAPCTITRNALPADARIVDATMPGGPPGYVVFTIESDTYPDVPPGHPIPEVDPLTYEFEYAGASGPLSATLTAEKLRELLYDAERAPGRTLALAVHPDGTIEAEPCAPTS
jgi:hypothetical protein